MATTLYVKPGCRHCAALRARLEQRGGKPTVIDVVDRPEVVPELLKLTGGRRIVPVLVDGVRVEIAPGGGSEF